MKKPLMKQCKLRRNSTETTSWIPAEFAKKYKYLKLKGRDGTWTNGWQVIEVGATKEYDQAIEDSQDYKHQREASDI